LFDPFEPSAVTRDSELGTTRQEDPMSLHDHTIEKPTAERRPLVSIRFAIVLVGFMIIAGVLLFSEHQAHVFSILLYALPFVCLFMHVFMHGSHGGHQNHDQHPRGRNQS
jgi:hypothetical protein